MPRAALPTSPVNLAVSIANEITRLPSDAMGYLAGRLDAIADSTDLACCGVCLGFGGFARRS
jgi:hypothetical protein